jgi:hypothetical protein
MSDPASDGGLPEDEITHRLRLFADALERELSATARVERGDLGLEGGGYTVGLQPARAGAMAVSWTDFGDELGLYAGTRGWWELDRDHDAVAFIEDVVRSVIAGRVYEVLGPARSRLVVTLSDGSQTHDTGYDALGLLPLPLWPRWGRRVSYTPYEDDGSAAPTA